MYKQGKLSDKEFFEKLGDYVVSYSSLEFLSVKVIFELKKALDKMAGGQTLGGQSGGTMPSGMSVGGQQASHVTAATLPGSGRPPSIISAATAFSTPGVLPPPDPSLLPKETLVGSTCGSCGSRVKATAKFCIKCGSKIQ